MSWSIETLNEAVDRELEALPVDLRARFVRVTQLIEDLGLPSVRKPHVGHVKEFIWEIRVRSKTGIARALYVTMNPQRVVIVRAFVKKTEKIPVRELNVATERATRLRERGKRISS